MSGLTPFEMALVIHLVADWLLQNDWMATHKSQLTHPAAWVHSGIHALLLGIVLGWPAGLVLGVLHMVVDTRAPLQWWAHLYGKTASGPCRLHVAIWSDQVLHITLIALWLSLVHV